MLVSYNSDKHSKLNDENKHDKVVVFHVGQVAAIFIILHKSYSFVKVVENYSIPVNVY